MEWDSRYFDIKNYEYNAVGFRRICWAKNFMLAAAIICLFKGFNDPPDSAWVCLWASVFLFNSGIKPRFKIKNPVDSGKIYGYNGKETF
tara:strand:+ start:2289 stop:2555 length:267 start_codon:yes stop_codon:yes gene_type:complete